MCFNVDGWGRWLQPMWMFSGATMLPEAGSAPWVPIHLFLLWFHGSLSICIAAALWRAVLRMGMSLEQHLFFFFLFLRWRKIFLNLDHLNYLISAQPNKQLPQHKCKWWHLGCNKRQGHLAKNSWITFSARGKTGSTPLEAHVLPSAFVASSLSSRRARVWIC